MASPQASEPSPPSPDNIHSSLESGYVFLSSVVEGSTTGNPSVPIPIDIPVKDFFYPVSSGGIILRNLSPEQLLWDLSLRDKHGRSLLHAAVSANTKRIEVVRFLVETDPWRSLVNIQNNNGYAPLHTACSRGHLDLVELLCVNGADVNLITHRMDTPLHLATCFGRLKVAQVLIRFGAEINARNKLGCIPLHNGASRGEFEICLLLISAGSEIDVADQADQTPLTHAVIRNHKEIALLLMSHSANMADKVEYEMLDRYPTDYKDGESKPRYLKKPRRQGIVRLSGCSPPVNVTYIDPGRLTESEVRKMAKAYLVTTRRLVYLEGLDCGYKLVKALEGRRSGFRTRPGVHHLNFIARLKRQSEAENKLFFAEVKLEKDHDVASSACSILGPAGTETGLRGCEICKVYDGSLIQHPRRMKFTKAR